MLGSRASLRWASACLLVLVLAATCSAQSDFGFYPEDSQHCLDNAAARTNCESSDVNKMNRCFCGNEGNFIINVAKCVGEDASDDVQEVYSTMQGACSNSDTPMSVSQSDFFDAADGKDVSSSTTTTTTRRPTSTQTDPTSTGATTTTGEPTSSSTNDPGNGGGDSGGGLSQGAIIGIGVGAGVGGLALVAALATFFIRRRRRAADESSPMLPEHRHSSAPTTFPPSEPSPSFGGFTDAKNSPASVSPYTNSNTHSGAWQSPPLFQGQQSPQPYPQQPYQAYSPPGQQQQQQYSGFAGQQTFVDASAQRTSAAVEIDGVQQNVAEMPGSLPPQQGWRL